MDLLVCGSFLYATHLCKYDAVRFYWYYLCFCAVSPQGTVFITPERIVVNRSESAALQCHVGGGPHNTVQWYHDGRLLEGETNPTLSLSIVGISDGGHYNCTAINAAGSGSSIAEVLSE